MKYAKFIVALAAVAGVFAKVAADGSINGDDLLQLGIAAGAAAGVFSVPNKPA